MAQDLLKIAVAGASGRMGHMLIEAVRQAPDCQLSGALDVPQSPGIGNDATGFLGQASGVTIEADVRKGLSHSQVLIDFTDLDAQQGALSAQFGGDPCYEL